jgi:hypothetical protein
MDLNRLRSAIEDAVSVPVGCTELPGIVDAVVRKVAISPKQLQRLATQLERDGETKARRSVEIEFFLRVSNADLLSSIQCLPLRVKVSTDESGPQAVASAEKSWAVAWERGIEPIK